MVFSNITNKSRYHYSYYYGTGDDRNINKAFDDCIKYITDTKTISENHVDSLIHWLTVGSSGSFLKRYCRNNDKKVLLEKIISKLNISHKNFRLLLKCVNENSDHEWISIWIKDNPKAKFSAADKRKLADIGFVNIFKDSTDITQKTFESFFSNRTFITDNFGTVTILDEVETAIESIKYSDLLDSLAEMKQLEFDQIITEHKSTMDSTKEHLNALKNNTINDIIKNSNVKITNECLTSAIANSVNSKNYNDVYILFRIIVMGNLTIDIDHLSNILNIMNFYDSSLINELIDKLDINKETINKLLGCVVSSYMHNIKTSFIKLLTLEKVINKSKIKITHTDLYKNLKIHSEEYITTVRLLKYLFELCGLDINNDVLDVSVKLNNMSLYRLCSDNNLTVNFGHLKHIILNQNYYLLTLLLDNKLILDNSVTKYCVATNHSSNQKSINTHLLHKLIKDNVFDISQEQMNYMSLNEGIYIPPNSAKYTIETWENGYNKNILEESSYQLLMFYIFDEEMFRSLDISVKDILKLKEYKMRNFFYSELFEGKSTNKKSNNDNNTDDELEPVKQVKIKKTVKVKKNKKKSPES